MNKFLKNGFIFEFDLKKPGSTIIKIPNKKIEGINSSNPIF